MDDALAQEAEALATSLANGPTLAYGKVKSLLNESLANGMETQMELESRRIAASAKTLDAVEGINAFLNKGKPTFNGQ